MNFLRRKSILDMQQQMVHFLIQTLNVPMIGEVHVLSTGSGAAHNFWRDKVLESRFHTSLATAYAALEELRNDVLLVLPGNHVQTELLTWAKDLTHLVGMSGPNQRYQPSTLTDGACRISTVTVNVAHIIEFTGHYCQMHNLGTFNSYSDADNLADIKITGKNFYAKYCSFRGGNGATQVATNGAGVPLLVNTGSAGGANGMWIDKCVIGSSGNTDRTLGPGCVKFIGGAAAGFGIKFTDCEFSSRISTPNANDSCLIHLAQNYAVDRELYFKGCHFYNFVENLASNLDYAFQDDCATTHLIVLHDCALTGIDNWTNTATYLSSSTPAASVTGGKGVNS